MKRKISCAFCNRPRLNNEKVFASDAMENNPNFLCEKCVKKCYIAGAKEDQTVKQNNINLLKPSEIAARVEEFVVGQNDAIKSLSVIFYNHFRRIKFPDLSINQKFHTLLLGPSGCGKTMMVTKMAELFNVPFVTVDSTNLTAAGYAGDDVDNCVNKLYEMSGKNIEKTEHGIIFVDEFDKCKRQISNGRDVKGEEVQFGFLKLLDGKDVYINNQKSLLMNEGVKINTSNILFVFGGFFDGINEKCSDSHISIFNNVSRNSNKCLKITPDVFIEYGMIPEIIGRINNYILCHQLQTEDLVNILQNKTSIIAEYKKLLKLDNIELDFRDDAIQTIAQLSNKACGARDLNSIVSLVLKDILFSAPDQVSSKVIVDKAYVLNILNSSSTHMQKI